VKVSIGDIRLWFDVLNPGLVTDGPAMREKPVLLALHGGPGFDHTDFKDLIEPLCDVAQVVLYDHRAMGRSDDCDKSLWTLDQWADDVHAFCAALGIERPVVLGWSFGGMVAQVYAAHYPDELAGLVLLSTAAQMIDERAEAAFERVGGAEARDLYRRVSVEHDTTAFEDYMRVCLPLYTVKRDPEYLRVHETRPIVRQDVTEHFLWGEGAEMDLRPELAKVVCPTLILNGRHDPITPPECSDDMEAALVNAPVTHVVGERSGHDVPEDEPELFAEAVRALIESCSDAGRAVSA
jgi:proline-specific peptidase